MSAALTAALSVALGGALGALARYGTALVVTRQLGAESHWATAAANLLGCAAIGAAVAWLDQREVGSAELRLLLVVGFLGAFTTFSTYALEALRLMDASRVGAALLALVLQPALGLLLVLGTRSLVASWLAD